MKIVCSANMPFAAEAFGTLGDVFIIDGRSIRPDDVRDADLLAIRSTTRVDRQLLDGSPVKFVGTATIGTDHMDIKYLETNNIRWCYAPGCNATSVSEYVTAALLLLSNKYGFAIGSRTLGVIGVGNVGGRVLVKGKALGMRVLANDPPRLARESHEITVMTDRGPVAISSQFSHIDELLSACDVITLHVPMTRDGLHPTYQLVDEHFFGRMKRGCIFINSSRGAVVKTDALMAAIDNGTVAHAVIDTWENEPDYRVDLLDRVDIGTPHIAGHSFDGKVKGTAMVYAEACRFLRVEPAWNVDKVLSEAGQSRIEVDAAGRRDEDVLWEVVRSVYAIDADDGRLRQTSARPDPERIEAFDMLRRNYHYRREFPYTVVALRSASDGLRKKVEGLGFVLS